jgi:hypothetical protein
LWVLRRLGLWVEGPGPALLVGGRRLAVLLRHVLLWRAVRGRLSLGWLIVRGWLWCPLKGMPRL